MKGRRAPGRTMTLRGVSPASPWQCSWWQGDVACLHKALKPWAKCSSSLHTPVLPDLLSVPPRKAAPCSTPGGEGEHPPCSSPLETANLLQQGGKERRAVRHSPGRASEPPRVQEGGKAQRARRPPSLAFCRTSTYQIETGLFLPLAVPIV